MFYETKGGTEIAYLLYSETGPQNTNDGDNHLFSIYCVSSSLIGNFILQQPYKVLFIWQVEIWDAREVYVFVRSCKINFGQDVNYVRRCQLQEAKYFALEGDKKEGQKVGVSVIKQWVWSRLDLE